MDIFVIQDSLGRNHKACKTLNSALEQKHVVQKEINTSKSYIGRVTCVVVTLKVEM